MFAATPRKVLMLTRKTLIDSLKANGLTGEVTIDSAKAYIAKLDADGIKFTDADGAAIDVDAVWSTFSAVKVADDVASVKGSKAPHAAIADNDEPVSGGTPQRFSIGSSIKKAYAAKIKSGRAVFHDADQAEAFGSWARLALLGTYDYGSQKRADIDICRKAQVEFNNQLGGALVPIEFLPNLVFLTEQYGIARKVANVVPMSRDVMTVPRKTGLASMVPVAETGTMTPADNSYNNVTLTAKKYGVLYQISRELMADSAVNIADDVARSIAESQAIAEDNAYFLGDGTSTYANQVGLANALPASAYVDVSLTWPNMTVASFTTVMGSVENVNPARLAFVCSRQFFAQVMLRVDKTANQFKELTMGGLGGDATFLGYPVFFSQVLPKASGSNIKSCYFGDFTGGTMLGDRRQLEIQTSDQFYFNNDSIAVRGTSRFCVDIHGDGRGSTYGPVVCLVGD
jgi:HK97 family phage major capsid protein